MKKIFEENFKADCQLANVDFDSAQMDMLNFLIQDAVSFLTEKTDWSSSRSRATLYTTAAVNSDHFASEALKINNDKVSWNQYRQCKALLMSVVAFLDRNPS